MEVLNLEKQIKQKAETQKKAGVELETTCQVCLKTKFADGVGHLCNYCSVRCCARCGGKAGGKISLEHFELHESAQRSSV